MRDIESYYKVIMNINLKYMISVHDYKLFMMFYKYVREIVTIDKLMNLERQIDGPPDIQFYYDVLELIELDMEKHPALYAETFISYYKKQYLSIINEVGILNNPKKAADDVIEYAIDVKYFDYMSERAMRVFLLLYKFSLNRDFVETLDECNFRISGLEKNPEQVILDNFIYSFFGEKSKYNSYIKRCRKMLSKMRGIPESNLNNELLKSILIEDIKNYNLKKDIGYAFSQFTIISQGGGGTWYNGLVMKKSSKDIYKDLRYYPDIDRIIENYYKSKMTFLIKDNDIQEVLQSDSHDDDFINLLIKKINFNEDFDEIIKMASIDVVYHLFKYTWKKLYELKLAELNGGFVVIENNGNEESSMFIDQTKKIEEMEAKLEDRSHFDRYIELQKMKYTDYIGGQNKNLELAYRVMYKALDEDRQEREQLKRKLEIQEQLLEEMQQPDPEPEPELDFSLLKGFKYLFAGRLEVTGLMDLKKEFPNSIFLEAETADISNIKVDAIILLTKGMSHSMFYKLKSIKSFEGLPWIYYNSKNVVGLYTKMYNSLFSK